MFANVIVRGEANRRWRLPVAPIALIRPDRARLIDRIIDYFGGVERRTAPASLFHPHPDQGRDDEQAKTTRW